MVYLCIHVKYALSFCMVFPGGREFPLRFRLRGKQGIRRYTTHVSIPAEPRGACSEHSKSLSGLVGQGVAFRLVRPSGYMENPTRFRYFSIARSALSSFYPLRSPARCTRHQSYVFYPLCCLLPVRRSSSSTTAAVPKVLTFVRVLKVYMYVVGAQQQQEIESRHT